MLNARNIGERTPIDGAVDLSDPDERERLSASGLKAFFSLMKAWKFREDDARRFLGGMSHARYTSLKREVEAGRVPKPLGQDELTRVSLLIGIAKALRTIHGRPLADAWVTRPNKDQLFRGKAPAEAMLSGGIPTMLMVRRVLDARRGFLG